MSIQEIRENYEELRVAETYNLMDLATFLKKLLPKGPLWRIVLPNESQITPHGIPSEETFGEIIIDNGGISRNLWFKSPPNYIGAIWNFGGVSPIDEIQNIKVYNESGIARSIHLIQVWETGNDPVVSEFIPSTHFTAEFQVTGTMSVPAYSSIDLKIGVNMLLSSETWDVEGWIEIREGSVTGPIIQGKVYEIPNGEPFTLEATRDH